MSQRWQRTSRYKRFSSSKMAKNYLLNPTNYILAGSKQFPWNFQHSSKIQVKITASYDLPPPYWRCFTLTTQPNFVWNDTQQPSFCIKCNFLEWQLNWLFAINAQIRKPKNSGHVCTHLSWWGGRFSEQLIWLENSLIWLCFIFCLAALDLRSNDTWLLLQTNCLQQFHSTSQYYL